MYAIRSYYAAGDRGLRTMYPPIHPDLRFHNYASYLRRRIGEAAVRISVDGGFTRITSYNVCYTKLLRMEFAKWYDAVEVPFKEEW